MRAFIRILAGLLYMFVGNQGNSAVRVYDKHPYPEKLSAWGIFVVSDHQFDLDAAVYPYDLVNPLFSDYAAKFRTVYVPLGQKALYHPSDSFSFPVGSVLTKTFAYPETDISFPGGPARERGPEPVGRASPLKDHTLVETRVLVHTGQGWVGLPYVWDADQKDASLRLIGDVLPVRVATEETGIQNFNYQIPNFNQCKGCHVRHIEFQKPVLPIGPKAGNLNRVYKYPEGVSNQLIYWKEKGILENLPSEGWPQVARWDNPEKPVTERARAYLDINCAHCHNPQGPANTSGLYLNLQTSDPAALGVCKSPVAVGNAGGGRVYDIVPGRPSESILYYRMQSTDPSVMMPELGRNLAHREGLTLIYQWIAGIEGNCGR